MTPFFLLLLVGSVLVALFVFALYRIARALLKQTSFFLSELLLAVGITGLFTAIASAMIYRSLIFAGREDWVIALFMSFFMLSVLAAWAHALHLLAGREHTPPQFRLYIILPHCVIACCPWIFILYAVLNG